MTLYDRCVDLQLKLEAAREADAGVELLARGAALVEALDRASEYLIGAAAFRTSISTSDSPTLDLKAATQAVSAFRAGLSRHGFAAFQHQPAATLAEVARSQRDRAARWVASSWRLLFADYDVAMARSEAGRLVGSPAQRVVAQARGSTLRAARGLDPLENRAELQRMLGGEDVNSWISAVQRVGAELISTVEALDAERAALTPEVRAALQRAGSEEGFPLTELTGDLLSALRAAGVDDQLVVRHQ
jgi:hypothetical protein